MNAQQALFKTSSTAGMLACTIITTKTIKG
jgi:hypothetical protein